MVERDIEKRTFEFGLKIVRFCQSMHNGRVGWTLAYQVLRSGTSIGANVEEAQGAQSKADFIAKMSIARKEARETVYWLRMIAESGLHSNSSMAALIQESIEISKIVSAIIVSARRSR